MTPLKWRYLRPVQVNTSAIARRPPGQLLDRVGEVLIGDVIVILGEPYSMRLAQHIGVGAAHRRIEFIAGKLEKKTQRIAEIDRIHEAAIDFARVRNIALLQPLDRLGVGGARYREGEMVDAAGGSGDGGWILLPDLTGEHGYEASIARIEIQVVLVGGIEIGLFEDERHAEHVLPEVDRSLTIGADQRDVMDALSLKLLHG